MDYETGQSFPVEDNPNLERVVFSEPIDKKQGPKPKNPWLSIWLRPRETIRTIVDYDPGYNVLTIVSLVGILEFLNRASNKSLGDQVSFMAIFFLAVIFGPLGGLIKLAISGAVIAWTGSKIGGQATSREVRTALAWSEVPFLINFLLFGITLAFLGEELFKDDMQFDIDQDVLVAQILLFGGVGISAVLGIWSFVIKVLALSEVQGFSAWRALGNLILAGFVIFFPIALFVVLFILPSL